MSPQPFTPGGPGVFKKQFGDWTIFAAARRPRRPRALRPFQLLPAYSDGANPELRLRIVFSTVAGDLVEGFNYADDPPFLLEPQVGTRVVLIKITLDESGSVTGREIIQAPAKPADTDTLRYAILGTYTFDPELGFTSVQNAGYGPVDVIVCYEDFTQPPEYNATITLK